MGHADVVREIVESCWADEAGRRRLPDLLAPDYVHHTPRGDVGVEGLLTGLAWVAQRLVSPRYVVEHVVVEVEEEVLAPGLGPLERRAVEQRGAGGEAALRAARRDRVSPERALQRAREPVQRVALGHLAPPRP